MPWYNKFNSNTQQDSSVNESKLVDQSFSTPYQEIGEGNLSLPYINDNYKTNSVVFYGADNLHPQILNQLYDSSPIHSSIVNFTVNATIGSGYDWNDQSTGEIKVNTIMFEKKYKFKKLIKALTKDFIIHARMTIIVTVKNGKKTFKRVNPETIRTNEFRNIFVFSSDWSTQMNKKILNSFTNKCKEDGEYLLNFQIEDDKTYPTPIYNGALNWIYLDGEQSFLHKSNIQNSIFPSLVLLRPKEFKSTEEKNGFYSKFKSNKGAKGAGNIAVFTANGKDELPELKEVNTTNNDKLFLQTSPEIKDNICFAHNINKLIIGVSKEGSLGNATELKTAYGIYEKNTVAPLRETLEDFFNELIALTGLTNSIKLKNYQLIDDEIIEVDEDTNKVTKALNAMNPIVTTKILESMSVDEIRALAGLEPTLPQSTSTTVPAEMATETNDALRGLSAKENMDMMRIIREYSKGKLNEILAIKRLTAYGLTEQEAKDILGIETI